MGIRHSVAAGAGSGAGGLVNGTDWDAAHDIAGLHIGATTIGGVVSGHYYNTMGSAAPPGGATRAANLIWLTPMFVPVTTGVDRIGAKTGTSGVNSGNIKFIVYSSGDDGWPDELMFESGDIATGTSTNTNHFATCDLTFEAGKKYWLGFRSSAATNLYANTQSLAATLGLDSSGNVGANAMKSIQRVLTYATAAPDPFAFTSADLTDAQATCMAWRAV